MPEIYTYRIPFKKPFVTASGSFTHREGVLLRYEDPAYDLDIVTEASPLPGFSTETLRQVINEAIAINRMMDGFLNEPFSYDQLVIKTEELTPLPSLRFAFACLGLSILRFRSPHSTDPDQQRVLPDSISVNSIIGINNAEQTAKDIRDAIQQGFTTLKCKVKDEPGHLPETLRKMSEKYPDIRFRLDPNQSWPVEKMREYSSRFDGLPIEYIEEPCFINHPVQYEEICSLSIHPVAADESIPKFGLNAVVNAPHQPDFFIVKPMLINNIFNLFATIDHRNHLDDRVIFTTSLESSVGVSAIARMAGLYGSRKMAHGLGTGSFFSDDVAGQLNILNGRHPLDISGGYHRNFIETNTSKIIRQT